MKGFLHHLFLPKESNNHRAKLLHHSSILILIVSLFALQIVVGVTKHHTENVLGISYSISPDELLFITNARRQEQGLSMLKMNANLSNAAAAKAQDMYAKNYWAHFAPDGSTSPWSFIRASGYDYVYAGENLARGYTSSSSVVDAWMASPSHRANMLSSNYQDVGFAIVPGLLVGDDTVLVVEMFGSSTGNSKAALTPTPIPTVTEQKPETPLAPIAPTAKPEVAALNVDPLIDENALQRNLTVFLLLGVLSLLSVDLFILHRRQLVRMISHNVDEIMFFGFVLVLVVVITGGAIL